MKAFDDRALIALVGGVLTLLILSTVAGVALNFLNINPIAALFLTSSIYGFLAAPLLLLLMLISGNRRIMGDRVNGPVVGSDTLTEYIRQARRDSAVRAIVLRIDSPGGSTTASDAIWRELVITKTERADRPLVVSMSDLAASGGVELYHQALEFQDRVAHGAPRRTEGSDKV